MSQTIRTPYWLLLLLALALTFCANPIAPEGGLKDQQPPQLIPEESTPNLQTRFEPQRIELTFDEWFEIQDVFNQVVVSPPLEYPFEITLKRKTLRFDFDEKEVLRPEATYTINFGEAVRDITERNPTQNLRFVFSTGDFIDSLSVSGNIVDAQKGEPVEGVLFMLYENLEDTVVRTERPFYFARTDKQGQFRIENVKAGRFKGFALLDANRNYLFDQAQEPIGFPDTFLVVNDSLQPTVRVKLFIEEQPLRLMGDDGSRYGLVRLNFSKPPEGLDIAYKDVGQQVIIERNPDTTKIWYDLPKDTSWNIYLQKDTILIDTVKVRARSRQEFLNKAKLQLARSSKGALRLNPTKDATLVFNHPITALDTSLMRLYEDTLRLEVQPRYSLDTNGRRQLFIAHSWKEGLPYELELMPGALTSLYGQQNDTLILPIQVDLLKSYGNLTLQFDSLSADSSYYVELLSKNEEVISSFTIQGDSTFQRTFRALPSGAYTVRLIEDWNGDGRWDTGSYDDMRQPEPIYLRPLEQLRSNWDLEAVINFVELRQLAKAPPAAPEEQLEEQPEGEQPQEPGKRPSRKDKPGRKPPSARDGN
ncbi:MAG: Ig-like domain-containing protein [Lewinellaceae bacterium]|nr:Ig-like domain-containing protein [Phaeodactylibacter sp.]MCB9036911.1 Ig-like domain-containing protein [Lewinellaceae bacterium]